MRPISSLTECAWFFLTMDVDDVLGAEPEALALKPRHWMVSISVSQGGTSCEVTKVHFSQEEPKIDMIHPF